MANNTNQYNYWVSSPYPHPVSWPKWMFHATKDPKQVNNPEELAALGDEWSENYADKKRDWPKAMYDEEGSVVVVASPEEQKAHGKLSDKAPAPKEHKGSEGPAPKNAK